MNSNKATPPPSWLRPLITLTFIALAIVATIEMRVREPVPGFQAAFTTAFESSSCNSRPVLEKYTGIGPIDGLLKLLVIAFLPATVGMDTSAQVFEVYFLLSFLPIIAIWSVEAGRKANRRSWISSPALYSLFYQTVAGAIVIPIYYLLYMRTTTQRPEYFSPASRVVTPSYAKALVPAVILGYLIPTIALFLPLGYGPLRQQIIAFWQPCPLFVAVLLQVFSRILPGATRTSRADRRDDLESLNATYMITGVVSAAVHFATLAYCYTSTDYNVSLRSVFDPWTVTSNLPLVAAMKYFFHVDFYVIFAATLVWAYLSVYELRWIGKTDANLSMTLVYLIVGTVVVGPAATLSATWYWRENVLAKMKTM